MPGDEAEAAALPRLLDDVLDGVLERSPVLATWSGDHRFDDRLGDRSPHALAAHRSQVRADLQRLEPWAGQGCEQDDVDLQTLQVALEGEVFALDELRTHATDPLLANPGAALHALLARDFAPPAERLEALAGRMAAVPGALTDARESLGPLPRVHLETALGQFTGTRALLANQVGPALAQVPGLRSVVAPAQEAALEAVDAHLHWLRGRLAATDGSADADPRLGPERFARRLALSLDLGDGVGPDEVLARAEGNLERVEAELAEVAAGMGARPGRDGIRALLDELADEDPVDDGTVVGRCRGALAATAAHVRSADLVEVPTDPVEVIVMPEVSRGVAVAYCEPPGALEPRPLPTWFAVAPTPVGWPQERVRSFYREYNAHMLHELTVHEAYPGHVLQLAHSRRYAGASRVRSVLWSGAMAEGWAVYAEELMVRHGYPGVGGVRGAGALHVQQLKMQLRMTINAVLDVRVHTRGMTETEAMALMVGRGHQEEGEAHGKWRRALLTSGQLSTYFVGYQAVRALADEMRTRLPQLSERRIHDAVLAHGTPAPRHLRRLLLPSR